MQEKVFWFEFDEKDKNLIRMRLDNKVLANKNEFNKDKVDKNKIESYIIVGLVTLALYKSLFKKIIICKKWL